ncbi:integrin alpha-M [Xenopus laevis]|uniref:Integrin alpha-M n=2 Tax=Xenopus laevis TaxID=8355 RepID=A0A1L8EZ20_XENLA|nr:integrin alpha-M [Xenopus laevis]OCT64587.1 hypothetical protein XELAEV_18045686mg [Xenopus laevis]
MAPSVLWLLLVLELSSVGGFFVDTDNPIIFRNSAKSFGYQVVELNQGVIISAPLHEDVTNKTGVLYRCNPATTVCQPIRINGSPDDFKASLGLSLAVDENNSQLLACGPTLKRTCGENIYVNGHCYQLDSELQVKETLPPSLPECNARSLDIVFLIDGSGSIKIWEFRIMLTFVSTVMAQFNGSDAVFALMQYSTNFETHFDFTDFLETRDKTTLTKDIKQQRGQTYTATAIKKVLEELFIPKHGSRSGSQKILIVITDGRKNDVLPYEEPIAEAERQGVLRFAIGVGNAFTTRDALEELNSIASKPTEDHVFQVIDFSALSQFQKQLQDKIFAIEGTQVQTGSAFQLEMSQDGFSSFLTSDGSMLGLVGAYDWSGGVSIFKSGKDNIWINGTQENGDMKAAYLGYALQPLTRNLIAVGAPRYQHTGSVHIYMKSASNWNQKFVIKGEQIGSYFGSVLSGGSVNSEPAKLLLLVGAPTYYSPASPGGRVYLCPIDGKIIKKARSLALASIMCPTILHGDPNQYLGHFGSTISILPDLTGDKMNDLAIGAPFEDQNQGAVYIFPGQSGGFRDSYLQRISSSQVYGGLMFFGRSLSGKLDMTKDGLPDLTIGSEGRVLILRSRPVLGVSVAMRFTPSNIRLPFFECPNPTEKGAAAKITVCMTTSKRSTGDNGEVSALLTYTLLLDARRSTTRAIFDGTGRSKTETIQLREGAVCADHSFNLPECVEDSLTPVRVALNFTLSGVSVLSEDSPTNISDQILFQKNCGIDDLCQDDLRITMGFADLKNLVVGLSTEVNATVSVQNHGEDSYYSHAIMSHPIGLSYRRVVIIQSNRRISLSCSVLNSEMVYCGINNPLLRPNTSVIFIVSFHVSSSVDLGSTMKFSAIVASDNGGVPNDQMKSSAQLKVLYGVYVTVSSGEDSTKYTNFSSDGAITDIRSVQHVYKVLNLGQRPLPLSVILMVPEKLKEVPVWDRINITFSEEELSNGTIDCSSSVLTPKTENIEENLKSRAVLDCAVMTCVQYVCNISSLDTQDSVQFMISGQVTKEWTTLTAQQKVSLQSSAELIFDSEKYQHILEQNEPFIRTQIQTVLEVNSEYNYLPIIAGSSVGGLLLLALITAGLYKAGFFKRQYKDMMEAPDGATEGQNEPAGDSQNPDI